MSNIDKRYTLEIYDEGAPSTAGATFYSDVPFLALAVGDLIHPGMFEHWGGERERDGTWMLEVTKLEHFIWQVKGSDLKHKLGIHTRYVPNTPATRGSK